MLHLVKLARRNNDNLITSEVVIRDKIICYILGN